MYHKFVDDTTINLSIVDVLATAAFLKNVATVVETSAVLRFRVVLSIKITKIIELFWLVASSIGNLSQYY